jgi:hypothetical protein
MAFDLDAGTGRSIEPDEARYLAEPVWLGRSALPVPEGPGAFCIPKGMYFFAQTRELPGRDGWIHLAVEVQKEGLWQRKNLGRRLYLRTVHEDGGAAAQIFRECF